MTLKEIVEQLEICQFTDKEGHALESNVAFIALKVAAQEAGDTVIEHDELVGYIMRRAWEDHGEAFSYPRVDMIFEYEMEFLREKGLIGLQEE